MSIKTKIVSAATKIARKVEPHVPGMLIVAAGVASVGSIVLACRATKTAPVILEPINQRIDEVRATKTEDPEDKNRYAKELADAYMQKGIALAKLYGPAIVAEGVSLFAMGASHKKMFNRCAALGASYASIVNEYGKYKQEVQHILGEEREEVINKVVEKETSTQKHITNSNGRETVVEANRYAKFWGELNTDGPCRDYEHDAACYNRSFLANLQRECQAILDRQGYLYLEDVLKKLDLYKDAKLRNAGWLKCDGNPFGEGIVDFGIFDADWNPIDERVQAFFDYDEEVVLLNFNCDLPDISPYVDDIDRNINPFKGVHEHD